MVSPRDFGRLEGKVDELLNLYKAGAEKVADLERRTRANEAAISHGQGRQSVISVISAAFVSIIVGVAGRHIA